MRCSHVAVLYSGTAPCLREAEEVLDRLQDLPLLPLCLAHAHGRAVRLPGPDELLLHEAWEVLSS